MIPLPVDDMESLRQRLVACACDLTLLRRRLRSIQQNGRLGAHVCDVMVSALAAVEDVLDAAAIRLDAELDRRHAARRGRAA
jgi:hypothetical protein